MLSDTSNSKPFANKFNFAQLLILWLVSLICVLGLAILSGMVWIMTVFFLVAYIALLLAILITYRSLQDWLNPLSLILIVGFVRFSIPGLLSLFGIEPNVPIYQIMSLSTEDWLLGHTLALVGFSGVIIGWFFPLRHKALFHRLFMSLKIGSLRSVKYTAFLGMLLGLAALLLFVEGNASFAEMIRTGEFRGIEIREGTGKYFYLSLILIASSVVLSAYLVSLKRAWWIALLPTVVAMILFWVLGGRARALTPVSAGLLLLWYQRHQKNNLKTSMKAILIMALIIALLIVFLNAGQLYRGGLGLKGILQALSISALLNYVRWAVWTDLGQLHSLAGAVEIGPGVLGGRTFLALLWPLSEIFNLPGRSAGIFLAERLVGLGERKWGFHATLIGDAYLNFGLIGVFIVTTVFGLILKTFYAEFRRGSINVAFYALTMIYSIRVFFESIEKYGEALTVLSFALFIVKFGQTLFKISRARERKR